MARFANETAGIDQADFGLGRVLRDQKPRLSQLAKNTFAVNQVLSAAETDQAYDQWFAFDSNFLKKEIP